MIKMPPKWRRQSDEARDPDMPCPSGFLRSAETRPEDVFIVGYPKSGHTWLKFMLADFLFGVDPAACSDALADVLVPDLDSNRFYRRVREPMVFKTHARPQPALRRVIYLLRDGRDVLVSYYHHLKRRPQGGPEWADLARGQGDQLYGAWHEHVEAWLANPHAADFLLVRYEELLADGVGQLRLITDFLGQPADEIRLAGVLERSRFDRLAQREQETASGARFFRRGQAGSHRDELDPDTRRIFEEMAGPTLRRGGYS